MLTAIAIVPSAPVMVPELAASAAGELADLREAVFAAASSLPRRWIAVGVGPTDAVIGPERAGTFAGYGVDVRVALSPDSDGAPGEMPLCALVTGWLRGQVDPQAGVEVRVYSDDNSADHEPGNVSNWSINGNLRKWDFPLMLHFLDHHSRHGTSDNLSHH